MLQVMQHQIKKYSYLSYKILTKSISIFIKKVRSVFWQIDPRIVGSFGVDRLPYPVRWDRYFDTKRILVEIGSGHGELLHHLATVNEDAVSIGFEISSEYTRRTEKKIKDQSNALVYKADAYPFISKLFDKNTVSKIYILFPDPWHKKRHHKRRPITSRWLYSIWSVLQEGGEILFVTDWDEYYGFVDAEVSKFATYRVDCKIEKGVYSPKLLNLIETHYYKKWEEIGRTFQYIKLSKYP